MAMMQRPYDENNDNDDEHWRPECNDDDNGEDVELNDDDGNVFYYESLLHIHWDLKKLHIHFKIVTSYTLRS